MVLLHCCKCCVNSIDIVTSIVIEGLMQKGSICSLYSIALGSLLLLPTIFLILIRRVVNAKKVVSAFFSQ